MFQIIKIDRITEVIRALQHTLDCNEKNRTLKKHMTRNTRKYNNGQILSVLSPLQVKNKIAYAVSKTHVKSCNQGIQCTANRW